MKVLDATFLIDYLNGVDATAEFLTTHDDEQFVTPDPVYAEALVGEGNRPDGSVAEAKAALSWTEVYETDETTAGVAAEVAARVGPNGPFLDGIDAVVAATGKELDATVVSDDGDLTHPEVQRIVDSVSYR